MTVNISTLDRGARSLFSLAILSLTFLGPKPLWILPGLALLATALTGFCPFYYLIGYSSCEPRLSTRGELKVLFAAAVSLGVLSMAVTALAKGNLSMVGLFLGLLAFPLAFMAVLGLFREEDPT